MKPLHVIDLAVARGDRAVLSDLCFSVYSGDILHLRGPNGVGKTSLLEVLSGLRSPFRGSIEGFPGRSNLHWVGHRNGLHAALSPLENLQYWCRMQGQTAEVAAAALQRVGLYTMRHRPCGRLSIGQRRRASLARLLALPRPWWMLDEPLAGLDVTFADILTQLMEEHATAGGAVILSSHQEFPRALQGLRCVELL